LVLADTTITYCAITKTEPIALLGYSRHVCREVIPTIIRIGSITLQTPEALSRLLENCKSQDIFCTQKGKDAYAPNPNEADASKADEDLEPKLSTVPKKLRLFCGLNMFLQEKNEEEDRRYHNRALIVPYLELETELEAWNKSLQTLPMGNLRKFTLDFTIDPKLNDKGCNSSQAMHSFTKCTATRLRTESKEKCEYLLFAPPLTLERLTTKAGSLVRAWTMDDEEWSVDRRIEHW
jgi:hypothetical protein